MARPGSPAEGDEICDALLGILSSISQSPGEVPTVKCDVCHEQRFPAGDCPTCAHRQYLARCSRYREWERRAA